MKVSVFSFAVNDKFPLDIMRRQFDKYIKEEFDFVLFNDASDLQAESNINTVASYNKIKSIRVPQHIHQVNSPSICYAAALNWAVWDYAVNNRCEVIALMHSDLFPICNVSISDIVGDYTVASTIESRKNGALYLYPALTIINMKRLNNPQELDFGLEPGLDTGARTMSFIRTYPNCVKFLAHHQIYNLFATMSEEVGKYYKEDLAICRKYGLSAGWVAEGFYHHMAGSQWNAGHPAFAQGHKERMDLFLKNFY